MLNYKYTENCVLLTRWINSRVFDYNQKIRTRLNLDTKCKEPLQRAKVDERREYRFRPLAIWRSRPAVSISQFRHLHLCQPSVFSRGAEKLPRHIRHFARPLSEGSGIRVCTGRSTEFLNTSDPPTLLNRRTPGIRSELILFSCLTLFIAGDLSPHFKRYESFEKR